MEYSELCNLMREFNKKHDIKRKVDTKKDANGKTIEMIGRVVIANSALSREFPLERRTYEFSNYNKALTSDDLGYSIFAYCKADDDSMRIEDFENSQIESAEVVSTYEGEDPKAELPKELNADVIDVEDLESPNTRISNERLVQITEEALDIKITFGLQSKGKSGWQYQAFVANNGKYYAFHPGTLGMPDVIEYSLEQLVDKLNN